MEQELFDELSFYTLAKGDLEFIHQHIVDAYAAQRADDTTKPIAVVFALVGLYLHLEKGFTGRQVQKAHMQMVKRRKNWPRLNLPAARGSVTVTDVIREEPGPALDHAIERWCVSVWSAYQGSRDTIAALVEHELDIRRAVTP